MRYLFILLFHCFFLNTSFAEICPLPAALKKGEFFEWQVLDINSAIPISVLRLAKFQAEVEIFALAEWMRDAPEGEAHCYYYGKLADSSYLGVFLAKKHLLPDIELSAWHKVNVDVQQCQVQIDSCVWSSW